MSRFDDDLRQATAPLAREPLPSAILDDALDAVPPAPRWPAIVGAVAVVLVLSVGVGIGVSGLMTGALPTSSSEPSTVPSGEPNPSEAAAEPSEPIPSQAVAEPSAPASSQGPSEPGNPITASAEELGIRLTVELDRDRTVFGQRVFATATIENIGSGSVYWGHSGSCVFPAAITATPDDSAPMPYGRDDWPGDAGVLKDVTVYLVADEAQEPTYAFHPEEWLDFDGFMGCTSDLQVSELPAGETLTHRIAWDTEAAYGMPPQPGTYTVDASFDFMSRGAEPTMDGVVDEFTVPVSLNLVVDGPDESLVSPGEAIDALLADAGFRSHLDATSRTQWSGSHLSWDDGRWVTMVFLNSEAGWDEPVEAVVGVVDARTGSVLSSGVEEVMRPGGG